MGYFKLDKIDKIVISFTLIIVTIFCIFNNFCFASENIDINQLNGLVFNINGDVVQSTNGSISYFEIEPGYKYSITQDAFPGSQIQVGFSDTIPQLGNKVNDIIILPYQETYTFNSYEKQYIYCDYAWGSLNMTVTREKLPSYTDAIYLLVDNAGLNLWNIFNNLLPFVLVVVTFSLGVWFIKHNIIEHSKGRDF